jgi:hypothetical protein
MHTTGPPMACSSRPKDWFGRRPLFAVLFRVEIYNFEGPHLATVLLRTILREAYQPAVEGEDSTRRSGGGSVTFDDWTLRMLFPWSFPAGRTI